MEGEEREGAHVKNGTQNFFLPSYPIFILIFVTNKTCTVFIKTAIFLYIAIYFNSDTNLLGNIRGTY